MKHIATLSLALTLLITPPGVFASSRPEGVPPSHPPRPSFAVPRASARAALREARHAQRLARVQGIVRGMTNKLDNLSQRLEKQLDNIERRIEALEDAGHDITVDTELDALRQAIAAVQTDITNAKEALANLPDSDSPRQRAATVRQLIAGIRTKLVAVRDAFQTLRLAVRDDVRSSSSPTPAATPAP